MNPIVVIWIVLLFGGFWFLIMRPRRAQMQRAAELRSALGPGDNVVTIGGIYGVVDELDGDDLWLEIADGVVIRVARRAVATRLPPDAEDEHEHEGDGDEDDEPDELDGPEPDEPAEPLQRRQPEE